MSNTRFYSYSNFQDFAILRNRLFFYIYLPQTESIWHFSDC
uniref:Uncharacterized protein n=1 Tax=virus sp. ct3kA5 TaxID=2826790 RepID=A0A8S5R707_9VIRU|nr:MAG TPA: hypothetical protein [virus sp. ct3kA5]DAM43770.1 MAG TPA: hypothetical protein [Caudoviricetes sp.]DAN01881.1 MAG TPA: hypothetical protein [Caudoviricetes sp.]DAX69406.1 MAG TPA: hypothetical protein [Caudoviricetes sp.]